MTEPDGPAPSAPVTLSGRIGPDDAPGLCACVCASAGRTEGRSLRYDVGGVEAPDVGTVEALARMALTARRLGRRVELVRPTADLRDLLELCGLTAATGSGVEVVGKPEQREVALRVEEERDRGDSIA